MQLRSLHTDLAPISAISLGSWNTFSRLTLAENTRLLEQALRLGVNCFDVGYYWDKPDTEAVFAAAMRSSQAPRDSYVLALKLWLWDYPKVPFADQARRSLERLGTDYADIVMMSRPTPGVEFDPFCHEIASLVSSGIARAWGATNWEAKQLAQARVLLQGRPQPGLVQLQYNVARRAIVESPEYQREFERGHVKLCAAFTLEGGILAGHLDRDRVNPSDFARGERPRERNIARDAGNVRAHVRAIQPELARIAARHGATAAQLAIAFAAANPANVTTLVGVTQIQDLVEDCGALALLASRDAWLPELAGLGAEGAAHPRLFDPRTHE